MTEYIYVLRLAPSGRVKVGRSDSLGGRLARHIEAAAFGGGHLDRVFSAACADSVAAERALLKAVSSLPGARIVHGRETFEGVTFAVAAAIAEDVVERALVIEADTPDLVPPLLRAVADLAGDLADDERLSSRLIIEKLAPDMTEKRLGGLLRGWGAPTGRNRGGQASGPRVGDVRAAIVRLRRAA